MQRLHAPSADSERQLLTTRRGFLLSSVSAIGLSACPALAAERDETLSVFLSDLHVSPSLHDNYQLESLGRIVDEILAMRPLPARAVVFGDIALGKGLAADYMRVRPCLMRLVDAGVSLHCTMGNHDHREPFLRVFPEAAPSLKVPGRIVSVVDLGTADLLLLDSLNETGVKEGVPNDGGGAIDPAQMEWLEAEVPRRTRPFICGAHHSPGEMALMDGEKRRSVLEVLKESEYYSGWVQGHAHRWEWRFNSGNSKDEFAFFRWLVLPSTGHWGDIGYVTVRAFPDRIEARLKMKDFYYPRPMPAGRVAPPEWAETVREKDGSKFVFHLRGKMI